MERFISVLASAGTFGDQAVCRTHHGGQSFQLSVAARKTEGDYFARQHQAE